MQNVKNWIINSATTETVDVGSSIGVGFENN